MFDSDPVPSVRTKLSSEIDDQPVHCTSAIRSQRSFSWWNTETLTIAGSVMSALMPPLYSRWLFTPALSRSSVGCSAGGPTGVGLSKLALPLTSYSISER